jgi:hypothetical protein
MGLSKPTWYTIYYWVKHEQNYQSFSSQSEALAVLDSLGGGYIVENGNRVWKDILEHNKAKLWKS